MDWPELDLKDRKTQIMLAGAAIVVGLILARLRGGGDTIGDDASTIKVQYTSDPGGPAYNGTFPQAPPIFTPAPGGDDDDDDDGPGPAPDGPGPGTGANKGWKWVNPAGKPYSCPAGSQMAEERGGTGNHVCVNIRTNQAFPVTLDSTGQQWTPADDKVSTIGKPYSCPAGATLAKESNGSGNDVCRWSDGRETRVIMNDTGLAWGVGGDGPPAQGRVRGLASSAGGFSPIPAPITVRREYTVRPGDSLATIASRTLGAPQRYPALLVANPQLRTVDRLTAGEVLKLP